MLKSTSYVFSLVRVGCAWNNFADIERRVPRYEPISLHSNKYKQQQLRVDDKDIQADIFTKSETHKLNNQDIEKSRHRETEISINLWIVISWIQAIGKLRNQEIAKPTNRLISKSINRISTKTRNWEINKSRNRQIDIAIIQQIHKK